MTGKERRESTSSGTSESSSSDEETVETKPSSDNVLNKYTSAGEIANTVLKEVIAKVKEGAVIGELCDHGDKRLIELTEKLFNKVRVGNKAVKVGKGIAMPTCISVDNIVCHYSPLKSEEPVVLKNGQVVKIDLGAHLDGFVGLAAHTVVVGADNKENKVSGKKADVIVAAHQCLEAALRCLHPSRNKSSTDVTDAIAKITKSFGVTAVENMVSHQLDRYKITGEKQITQNPSDDQRSKLEKHTFENYDVFAIDVLISTGDGKSKIGDQRTTVYKKNDDAVYSLKMKASRLFYSEVQKRFQNLPFSLRMFENENAAKMGLKECTNHGLITPYNVMVEKDSDIVAHFKATALVLPNGIFKTAGLPFESDVYQTDLKVEDAFLSNLLKEQLKPKKKKKPAATATTDDKKETAKPAAEK
ncbi:Peptidase-M24 domain-containing protein [Aphelenchoides besseyi]|nr:Peptidase-M24 domain-containing protein [Aphelenchoides besseyi]KAI6224620.1 Peptidase-M24 domain-containing protein [Aphelenchoides besseyi]